MAENNPDLSQVGLGNRPNQKPQPLKTCCPAPIAGGDGFEPNSVLTIDILAGLPTEDAVTGTEVYVDAVQAFYSFVEYQPGTAPPVDEPEVVSTTQGGDTRWVRQPGPSVAAQAQATWFIDGTSGDDNNTGLTALAALATMTEFVRRTGDTFPLQNALTLVNVANDPDGLYSQRVTDPSNSGRVLRFVGANAPADDTTADVVTFTPPDPTDATAASIGTLATTAFAPDPLVVAMEDDRVVEITLAGTTYYGTVAFSDATTLLFTNLYEPSTANGQIPQAVSGDIPAGTDVVLSFAPSIDIGVVEGDPHPDDGSAASLIKSVQFVGMRLANGRIENAKFNGCIVRDGTLVKPFLLGTTLQRTTAFSSDIFGGSLGNFDGVAADNNSIFRQKSRLSGHTRLANATFFDSDHSVFNGNVFQPLYSVLTIGALSQLFVIGANGVYGDAVAIALENGAQLRRDLVTSITKDGPAIGWPIAAGNTLWDDTTIPPAAPSVLNNVWNGAGNYNTAAHINQLATGARTYILPI